MKVIPSCLQKVVLFYFNTFLESGLTPTFACAGSMLHSRWLVVVMCRVVVGLGLSWSSIVVAQPAFELGSYLRAGSGLNLRGGKQECFNNAGASSNEFRLGNECGFYGEVQLRTHLKGKSPAATPESQAEPFFRVTTTLAFFPPGDSQYEDSDSDGRELSVVEAFAEGGFFDGLKMSYWAGKRFYRAGDVHIYDFYNFAAMSGIGGGVGDIDLGFGKIKIALLNETARESALLERNGDAYAETTRRISTTAGALGKTAFDVQITEIQIADRNSLHLWSALAWTPPGTNAATAQAYQAGRGWVVGARHHRTLDFGFNQIDIVYGSGIMQSLAMWGGTALEQGSTENEASRFRLVEHLTKRFSSRWSAHFAAVYEARHSGAAQDARSQWWSFGVRPTYFVTDHFHVLTEMGHSVVDSESDRLNGERVGPRRLTRLTVAPQVSMARDVWARPSIRFYLTHSFWNSENQSFIGSGAPAFSDATSGTSMGVQTEAWF